MGEGTTLNTYSHMILSLRGKTASAMDEVLGEEEDLFRGNLPSP